MLIEARAKINWSLDITGQREDGYHLMDMLMQPVTLCDLVTLLPASEISLTTGGFPHLPANEKNLAWRAAAALKEATGYAGGASIHIHKRIPVGAGMGGGSSDAAAVLWGLNQLWKLGLNQQELERIGLTLGADVPFCLRGGLMRTTGIGEVMEALPCAKSYPLVVIQPCRGLSTGTVFTAYHEQQNILHPDTDAAQKALAEGNDALLAASLGNVLQPVSEAMRPAIPEALQALRENGAFIALMTGSGSAVFGVMENYEKAAEVCRVLRERWRSTWLCRTCHHSLMLRKTK